jgi:hypothetical protein
VSVEIEKDIGSVRPLIRFRILLVRITAIGVPAAA